MKGDRPMREHAYKESSKRLDAMSDMSFGDIDPEEIKDISQITIDNSKPIKSRLRSLIEQTGNPYFFKDGDILVKLSYANKGRSLQSCMEEYLASQIKWQ
jgi:hypothetical protein